MLKDKNVLQSIDSRNTHLKVTKLVIISQLVNSFCHVSPYSVITEMYKTAFLSKLLQNCSICYDLWLNISQTGTVTILAHLNTVYILKRILSDTGPITFKSVSYKYFFKINLCCFVNINFVNYNISSVLLIQEIIN